MSSTPTRPAIHPTQEKRSVAVIDIGATSIRMAIADIDADGNVHLLESLVAGGDAGQGHLYAAADSQEFD